MSLAAKTRTRRLTRPGLREALATRLERAAEPRREPAALSAVVSVPPSFAHIARPALLGLARDLRGATDARPEGIALVRRLLVDGDSPLYRGPTVDEALRAINEARDAL